MRLAGLFAVFALLALAIETALPHLIPIRAIIPNLVVILAVDLGLRHHGAIPALIAFAMGYAADAVSGSHFGLNAFMVTATYLASYEISSRLMVTNAFVGAMTVFFAVMLTGLGTLLVAAGLGGLSEAGPVIPKLALQGGITAAIAPLVFSILAGSKRAIGLEVQAAR